MRSVVAPLRAGIVMVFVASSASACRTPIWVNLGDQHLRAGEPELALAAYEQARAEGRVEDEDELVERRDRAAVAVASALRDRLVAQKVAPEAALRALGALLLTEKGAVTATAMMPDLEIWSRAMLESVEADLARGRTYRAVKNADLVRTVLVLAETAAPAGLVERADRVIEGARAYHVERASSADPARAYLHAWLAGEVGVEPVPPAPFPSVIPGIDLVLDAVAPSCPEVARELEARYPRRPGGDREVHVHVVIDRCPVDVKIASRDEPFRTNVMMPSVQPGTETVFEDAPPPPECVPGPCRRFDELGVCVDAPPLPVSCAEPRARVAREKPVSRVVWSWEARDLPRTVWDRMVNVALHGTMTITAPDRVRTEPIELAREDRDQASWTVGQSVPFAGRPEDKRAWLLQLLFQRLDNVRVEEAQRNLQSLRRLVAEARDAGRDDEVESLATKLALAGDPSELAVELQRRHAVPFEEAQAFAQRRRPLRVYAGLEPWRVPSIERPRGHEWLRTGSSPRGSTRGLAADVRSGFNLAYFARGTSLAGAERVHGVSFLARIHNLHLGLTGMTPGLGGDVSGWRVTMTGVNGDFDDDGWDVRFGLGYEAERSERERWQFFGVPVTLNVGLVGPLSFVAKIDLNVLVVADLFDENPAIAHYSPIAAGLRLDRGPWMLEVTATRDLGSSGGPLVRPAAMIGVRL